MFLWLLLVPVPASLTTEVPHAVRTLIFLPSFQIITALGIEWAFLKMKTISTSKQIGISLAMLVIVVFFCFQYFNLYFVQMNHEVSNVWQFGYGDVVSFVEQNRTKYKKVIVSNSLEQPYIFFLFYLRYDPRSYLAAGGTKTANTQAFDIFEFRSIDWQHEVHDHKHLYILAPNEKKPSSIVHIIRYFDSNPAFILAE